MVKVSKKVKLAQAVESNPKNKENAIQAPVAHSQNNHGKLFACLIFLMLI